MKFRRTPKIQKGHLDITPLIDVVFLLLIFFMLSSSFILQSGIKVDLPNAVSSEVLESQNNIVTISENKNLYFNDKLVSIEELEKILIKISEKPLIIQADTNVVFEMVVNVWDICRKIGVEQLNISANQTKS